MTKLLKSIAFPLFCLFTAGALLPSVRAFDAEKIPASSVRIVSLLDGDNFASGTGFLVNENGNIVTNQRVVNGATQIFALQHVGGVTRLFRCKCEASQRSEALNLAVLTSSIKASPLVMNTVEPKPTSRVYAVGFPGISGASSEGIGSVFITAVLKKRNDPALDAEGVDMTREMSANKLLQDMVIPSLTMGTARRITYQTMEAGSSPVKIIDCDLNTRHGYSGGPLLDDGGYVIGVVSSGVYAPGIDQVQGGIAASELERFLAGCKISFHRSTSGKR
jgi:S1-C subfamily serine protease